MQKTSSCIHHSQNFITSRYLLNRIVSLSTINKDDTVLEIGTGKGHLTEILAQKAGTVYSIELDQRLFCYSQKKLASHHNIKLIQGDFLTYRLPTRGAYKVFANIPYNLTTQIIDKLTGAPNPPAEIWLIMEKGAAKRFAGLSKETQKSLLLKPQWQMKILYHFRREDFHPSPAVDSVLLHFSRREKPDLSAGEYAAYQRFIAHSMRYGLCSKKGLLTPRQVRTALHLAGLPFAHESGITLYVQWLCLFRYYRKQK